MWDFARILLLRTMVLGAAVASGLAVAGVGGIGAAAVETAVEAAGTEVADAAADATEVVHARIAVPEPSRKVGEVRLLSRGESGSTVVVQTLLSTRVLDRVVGEIAAKERANLPLHRASAAADNPAPDIPGPASGDASTQSAGPTDSGVYIAALEAAADVVDGRVREGRGRDRQRRLLIEFVADAERASVWIGTFTIGADGEFTPESREPLATLAPSRAWVLRTIRLILADAFGLPEADVWQLGPLGPATPLRPAHEDTPTQPIEPSSGTR